MELISIGVQLDRQRREVINQFKRFSLVSGWHGVQKEIRIAVAPITRLFVPAIDVAFAADEVSTYF